MKIATIIYDGSCNFCSGNLRWFHRLDWFGQFDSLPCQSEELYKRFPKLTRSECANAMCLAFSDGRFYAGADALREVFLRMPLTLVIGILMAISPISWLLRKLYPVFYPYRHHLSGRCPVNPTPESKHL